MDFDAINPGGSLGDAKFPIPKFETFEELENYMEKYHGYEASNNLFFGREFANKEVVEVGCGHGFVTFLISQRCKSVTGYDIDKPAIDYAEEMRRKFNVQNVKFVSYDGTFRDGSNTFDVAISMDVIEHVPNPTQYLKEIYKILKPGGVLLVGTPNGMIANKNKCIIRTHSRFHIMEYTPSELVSFLQQAGFEFFESYANKNTAGRGYDITFTRRLIINVLCKLRMLGVTSRLIQVFLGNKNKLPEKNSSRDWDIRPIPISEIDAHNCDVIIYKAIKN
ncbi:MAG: class I SAM-dependent methyltransferase [Thermoplasmataceae archaeon]